MLREIGAIRQDSDRGLRRWFQDDYFDLYVWQDAHAAPIAFELCYARGRGEGVIGWKSDAGFRHARVDGGERPAGIAMTPFLRYGDAPPYFRIYHRFLDTTADWEPVLRSFLIERLREYRKVLFGVHRKPRRRPRRAPLSRGRIAPPLDR
jgi:hypothetical protein